MRKRKYTREFLEPLIESSFSISAVLSKLGLKNTGGNYRLIQIRTKEYGISMDHFTGKSWNKGLTKKNSESILRGAHLKRTPDEEVFCENSGFLSSRIFKRLIEKGIENKCSIPECGISEWLGNPIRLHVDHINGINSDNRIQNLRLLCPNCHQQTDTWGNKKNKKGECANWQSNDV